MCWSIHLLISPLAHSHQQRHSHSAAHKNQDAQLQLRREETDACTKLFPDVYTTTRIPHTQPTSFNFSMLPSTAQNSTAMIIDSINFAQLAAAPTFGPIPPSPSPAGKRRQLSATTPYSTSNTATQRKLVATVVASGRGFTHEFHVYLHIHCSFFLLILLTHLTSFLTSLKCSSISNSLIILKVIWVLLDPHDAERLKCTFPEKVGLTKLVACRTMRRFYSSSWPLGSIRSHCAPYTVTFQLHPQLHSVCSVAGS